MAKTHKTITLCQESREIAENMQNFSAFVRECLLAHQHRGSDAQRGRTISIWMDVAKKMSEYIAEIDGNTSQAILNDYLKQSREWFNRR